MSNALQSAASMHGPARQTGRTCYILHLHLSKWAKIESAECAGVDEATARRLADAAAIWRDEKFRIKRLADACRELNLPTLAVVQTIGNRKKLQFDVPPPLDVPFEPIELDETQPALSGMVETLVLNSADSDLAEVKKARWLGRMFVRIGAPAIALLNIGIQAITQTIAQTAKQGFHLWFVAMWVGILGVTIGACCYAFWRTSAQWYVIPGGVIVRRTFWKNVGTKLERFIPADTMLMLAPDNIGWVASLFRGDRAIHHRRLTRMEATALLASWQSPIPPRGVEEISDLL